MSLSNGTIKSVTPTTFMVGTPLSLAVAYSFKHAGVLEGWGSRVQITLNGESFELERPMSLVELLIVIAIILVIAAIAVPQMNKQLMSAHEMAAIRQITTVHQAQTQYYSQFGKYAENLAALGPPAGGAPGPAAADLIPKDLAEGKKSGYLYTLAITPTGYAITAVPEKFGSSGRRSFYSDQTLGVRNSWTAEPANAISSATLSVSASSVCSTVDNSRSRLLRSDSMFMPYT